jgi:hypothetical protein
MLDANIAMMVDSHAVGHEFYSDDGRRRDGHKAERKPLRHNN